MKSLLVGFFRIDFCSMRSLLARFVRLDFVREIVVDEICLIRFFFDEIVFR